MKKKFTSVFIAMLILLTNADAQINRSNSKKANAYRGNYQRMASGANASHILEIREGTLWAWGDNLYGQLGDGTTIDKHNPIQIGTDNKWINAYANYGHSCGLKSDGTLWAWGSNSDGCLGDGTNIDKLIPCQIGTDNDWISIASGFHHTLGLKSNGTLWAWGLNDFGQLGDGTIVQRLNPVQIGTDSDWINIATGWM